MLISSSFSLLTPENISATLIGENSDNEILDNQVLDNQVLVLDKVLDIEGPRRPLLLWPVDLAETGVVVDFVWVVGFNAENHRILIDSDPDLLSPVENVLYGPLDNIHTSGTLAEGTYYWAVIAINEAGENQSLTRSFTVLDNDGLDNQVLSGEDNVADDNEVSDDEVLDNVLDNEVSDNEISDLEDEDEDVLDTLIILDSPDRASMQQFVNLVEDKGAHIMYIYPPHVLIGYVPENLSTTLAGWDDVAGIYSGAVNPSVVGGKGTLAIQAVRAWNNKLEGKPSPLDVRPEPAPISENPEPTPPSKVSKTNSVTLTYEPPYYSAWDDTDVWGVAGADSWSSEQTGDAWGKAWAWTGWGLGYGSHSIHFTAEATGEVTVEVKLRYIGGAINYLLAFSDIGYYSYINGEQYQEGVLEAPWLSTLIGLVDPVAGIIVSGAEAVQLLLELQADVHSGDATYVTWSRTFDVVQGQSYTFEAGMFAEAVGGVLGYSGAVMIGQNYQIRLTGEDTTPPPTPALQSPADGTITSDNTPTFEWTGVSDFSGVAYYGIWVDNDPDFSSPEIVSGKTATSFTPVTGLADENYSWRVRAFDGAGNVGEFSSTRTFVVDTVPPAAPTLFEPADNSTTSDGTPTFTWSVVSDPSGISAYEIWVDDDSDFSSPEILDNTTSTSYTPAVLLTYGNYSWRVRAYDGAGHAGDWSSIWTFMVPQCGSTSFTRGTCDSTSFTDVTKACGNTSFTSVTEACGSTSFTTITQRCGSTSFTTLYCGSTSFTDVTKTCGSTSFSIVFQGPGYTVWECNACGAIYTTSYGLPAKCTAQVHYYWRCNSCGRRYYQASKPSSCTRITGYKCNSCGTVYNTKPSSCTKIVDYDYKCNSCGTIHETKPASCPIQVNVICGSTSFSIVFQGSGYTVWECNACGTAYTVYDGEMPEKCTAQLWQCNSCGAECYRLNEPTSCTAQVHDYWQCDVCGAEYYQATAPSSCTAICWLCDVCGAKYYQENQPAYCTATR